MVKTIFVTTSATLIVVTFVASTFLNSILGLFGLASTSIETLNDLKSSKQIVEKMRKRHKAKELGVSKRYVKRSSKKIASSAVAAATIGTAGVVMTVAGLEVYDYCDDREELNEDENILFSQSNEFSYNECLSAASEDSKQIIYAVKEAVPKVVDEAWEETKSISRDTWESAKEMSNAAWEESRGALKDYWKIFTDWLN